MENKSGMSKKTSVAMSAITGIVASANLSTQVVICAFASIYIIVQGFLDRGKK